MDTKNPLFDCCYKPLPTDAANLCAQTSAPPRLVAHLILVHDTAAKLVDQLIATFPDLAFDQQAVLFGAATHDIGKATHRQELTQPGKNHEQAGRELLTKMGSSADRARFAYTHGNWNQPGTTPEDLIVALADNCWKGKRVDELETKFSELLSRSTGNPPWACYAQLDEILESLAQGADERLARQQTFSAD
jgi:putative nucleotidyltransferase with HDIG domain